MRTPKTLLLAGLIGLGLIVFVGCSDDDDELVPPVVEPGASQTIGVAGGQLEITNELALTVPANALADDVDFTAAINTSPPAIPSGYDAVTPVYSIEPSGTAFTENVTLRLNYDESDLGGSSEDDLIVFSHDGTGWDALGCSVYEALNYVQTDITHLSDFVVAEPQTVAPGDAHVVLDVSRTYIQQTAKDVVIARNDIVLATISEALQGGPGSSLQVDAVSFGSWDLLWQGEDSYGYFGDGSLEFLTIGSTYDFVIDGNESAASLSIPVAIMDKETYLTSPIAGQSLPLAGFTAEWQGTDAQETVDLLITAVGGVNLAVTVPNTGSHTFDATDLGDFSAGAGNVTIFWQEQAPIVADGYLEDSHVLLHSIHTNPVLFTSDAVINDLTVTSSPNLFIPDGPSGGGAGTAVTDIINVPAVGVVDSVRVYLGITHQWPSDLIVRVTSPDGTQLRVLFIGEGGEPEHNVHGWYPGDYVPKDDLNGFDGESSNGDWTVTAQDYSHEQTGVLNEWRLQIFYSQ